MKYLAVCLVLLSFALTACRTDNEEPVSPPVSEATSPEVVEIITRDMAFHAPSEIASGWTTIRLSNEGAVTHFALISRLPDGYGIEDQLAEVAPVFVERADLLYAGETDAAIEVFGRLPEWFQEVRYVGGPGLVSPGYSTEITLELEPGTYAVECYVKTNEAFHPMVHELTVLETQNGAVAPEATYNLTIASDSGIQTDGDLQTGPQTIGVHFADQVVYEHSLGHDVHLVQIGDNENTDSLAAWMDWTKEAGLNTPPPVTFLGGTQDAGAGQTVFLNVDLQPGRYAWIAEVPEPESKGMLVPFTVIDDK